MMRDFVFACRRINRLSKWAQRQDVIALLLLPIELFFFFMWWPKLMPYSFFLEYGGVCVLIYIYIKTHSLPIFKKKRHYMIWFVCILVFTVLNFMGWPKLMSYSFLLEYGGVCVLIYIYILTHTHTHSPYSRRKGIIYDLIRLYFSIHSFKFWYKVIFSRLPWFYPSIKLLNSTSNFLKFISYYVLIL